MWRRRIEGCHVPGRALPPAADDMPAAERLDGVLDDWGAYTCALHEAGVLFAGAALRGVDAATTVRVRQGKRLVSDGPFAETTEQLAGYYLIGVADLDAAIEWAAKVPNVRAGSVEVRPLRGVNLPGFDLRGLGLGSGAYAQGGYVCTSSRAAG